MGQGSSAPHPNDELRRQFSSWSLEQMRLSYKQYKEITIRFSVDIAQFADILALDETAPETGAAFKLFSTKRTPTMVDALEVLSGICMFCEASLAEKIGYVFTLYDFNDSGTLTPDELTILMRSTTRALAKIGGTPEPTVKDIERLCDEAFITPQSCEFYFWELDYVRHLVGEKTTNGGGATNITFARVATEADARAYAKEPWEVLVWSTKAWP